MTASAKWLKRDGLACEELEGLDEVVYLDPDDGSSFALNTTASAVLDLCDGRHTADDITDVLCSALPAQRAQVAADVRKILKELAEFGLVRTV